MKPSGKFPTHPRSSPFPSFSVEFEFTCAESSSESSNVTFRSDNTPTNALWAGGEACSRLDITRARGRVGGSSADPEAGESPDGERSCDEDGDEKEEVWIFETWIDGRIPVELAMEAVVEKSTPIPALAPV